MQKKLVFFLVVLVILSVVVMRRTQKNEHASFHYAYVNDKSAYTGVLNPGEFEPILEKTYGMIVSHHFYTERLISEALLRIKDQKPSTVVIIGPDHFSASQYDITVSKLAYETPFGLIEPDEKIIENLEQRGVFADENAFEHEHSISALVGIIKGILPGSKIVPIILGRNLGRNGNYARLDQFALDLYEALPEDSLVVASVDFSHHLNRFAADFHDEKSTATIHSFAFEDISKLEIDSPPSIYTLLRYLQLRQAQKIVYSEYSKTNFALLSGNEGSEDVTSYFFVHFVKGEVQSSQVLSTLYVPQGFEDFESIKGVEGNFLKGFDRTEEYDQEFLEDLQLTTLNDPNIQYAIGEIFYQYRGSRYFIFPFSKTGMLNYKDTLEACGKILQKRKITNDCIFYK